MIENKAYKVSDIRKFRSDKDHKEKSYNFCSPIHANHSIYVNPVMPQLEYLGSGVIAQIG